MRFLIGGVTIVIVYNFLQVSSLPHRISIRSVDDAGCENDECTNAIDKLNVSSLNSLNQYPCQTQPNNEQNCTFFIEQFLNTLYKLYNPNCHCGISNVRVIIEKESEAKPSKGENNDNAVQTITIKATDKIPIGNCSFDSNLSSSEPPPTNEPLPEVSVPIESAENKNDISEPPVTSRSPVDEIVVTVSTQANESKSKADEPELTTSIPRQEDETVSPESPLTNEPLPEEVVSLPIKSEENNDETSELPVVNPVEINLVSNPSTKEEILPNSNKTDPISLLGSLFDNTKENAVIPQSEENNDGTSELPVTTLSPNDEIVVIISSQANESEPNADEQELTTSIPSQEDEIVSPEPPPTNEPTPEVVSVPIESEENKDDISEVPVTNPSPDNEIVVTVSSQANESEPKADEPELTASIPSLEDETMSPEPAPTNESSPEEVVSVLIKNKENNDDISEPPVTTPSPVDEIVVNVSSPANESEPTADEPELTTSIPSQEEEIVASEPPPTNVPAPEVVSVPIESEENKDDISEVPIIIVTPSPDDETVVTVSSQANESKSKADETELTTSIPSQEDETMSPESPLTNESSPEEVVSVLIKNKENNDDISEPPVTTPSPVDQIVVTVSSQANESEPTADEPEFTTSIPSQEDKIVVLEPPPTNEPSPEEVVSVPIKSEENNDETSELPVVNPVEINLVLNPSNTEETLPTSNKTDPISLLGYLFDNAKGDAVIPQSEENNDGTSEPPVTTPSPVDEIVVNVSSQANESKSKADEPELTTSFPSQEDETMSPEPPPTNERSPEEVVSVLIKNKENNDDISEPPVTTPSPVDEIVVTVSSQANESEPTADEPEFTTSIPSQEDKIVVLEPPPTNEPSPEEVVSVPIKSEENNDETSELPVVNPVEINLVSNPSNTEETLPTSNKTDPISLLGYLFDNAKRDAVIPQSEENNDGTSEPPVTTPSPVDEIVVNVSSQAKESKSKADEPELTTSIPSQEDETMSPESPLTNESSPEEVVSVLIKNKENNNETSELPVVHPVEINVVSNPSNKEETLPTSNKTDPISSLKSLFDNTKEFVVIRTNCSACSFYFPQQESGNEKLKNAPFYYVIFPKGKLNENFVVLQKTK